MKEFTQWEYKNIGEFIDTIREYIESHPLEVVKAKVGEQNCFRNHWFMYGEPTKSGNRAYASWKSAEDLLEHYKNR